MKGKRRMMGKGKTKGKSLREWIITKLGGITKQEWLADFDRHIIKTEVPIKKLTVTCDFDTAANAMGESLLAFAKCRLMEKLAHDLIEYDIARIESYKLDPHHDRYVATLYICQKE